MSRRLNLAAGALPLILAGCATLGTNIEGNFTCRAPKGDCAPSSVIDARATGTAGSTSDVSHPQPRLVVGEADTARTRERMLKIVFPAHIDEQGVLHDEAVVHAVVEPSGWAVAARGAPSETHRRSAAGAIADQIKAAKARGATALDAVPEAPSGDASGQASDDPVLPLASRSVLPSTAREAVAGAHAPVIEGFDMSPLHDRTPRSYLPPLQFPDAAAIDAAHRQAAQPGQKIVPYGPAEPDLGADKEPR